MAHDTAGAGDFYGRFEDHQFLYGLSPDFKSYVICLVYGDIYGLMLCFPGVVEIRQYCHKDTQKCAVYGNSQLPQNGIDDGGISVASGGALFCDRCGASCLSFWNFTSGICIGNAL